MTDGQSPKVPLELFSRSSLQDAKSRGRFLVERFPFLIACVHLLFSASFEYHNLLCVGRFSIYLYTIKGSSKKLFF